MRAQRTQAGFHIIELLITMVVLGVLGFIGYRLWTTYSAPKTASISPAPSASVPAVPQITTSKDLDSATNTLNQLDTSANLQEVQNIEQTLNSL
jgi:prepilin-type N-terminal cleavage/methylation domain-containing protein